MSIAEAPAKTKPPNVFDEGAVLERVGGNLELLQELVTVFREDCSRLLPDLRAALQHKDPVGVRLAAHTLKGMVSFFNAKTATETAYALEKSGAAADLTGGQEELVTLVNEIERLQANLATVIEGKLSPQAGITA